MKPDTIVLKAGIEQQRFVVDVYDPRTVGVPLSGRMPAIVIVIGGGGKALITGDPPGKYARAYNDIAWCFAEAGFYTLLPSRRGDPKRQLIPSRTGDLVKHDDPAPNEGEHTHSNNVEELHAVIEYLLNEESVDSERIGLYGKSAGGGIALKCAASHPAQVSSIALWGSALTTSQWFKGPLARDFFKEVLFNRNIRVNEERFVQHIVDAIDYVGEVTQPILFACAAPDPYADSPPEPDKWSTPEQQLQLLNYSIKSRHAYVAIIKGAEHTMYAQLPKFGEYAQLLVNWFQMTLKPL